MSKREMCNTYHKAPVQELPPSGTDELDSGRLRPGAVMLINKNSIAFMPTYLKRLER